MPWPFCPQCGTILDPPAGDHISCDVCAFSCKFADLNSGEVVTVSAIRSKPAWLGEEDTDGGKKGDDSSKSKHATIQEPCPKCHHPEMYFYTMQLRSVDEGSTVFYQCPKCDHKYSVNN